jgi:ABC-type siderophore export system fused ATPase/permease subunit
MDFLTDYEGPLRSYIQESITVLGNALEEEVRNCASVDISVLEQQFDRESENFIAGITQKIYQIRNEIKAHRPTNTHSANYQSQMIQYRIFIQSSAISMNRMADFINAIFEQVIGLVKWIIQWLAENAKNIVEVLEIIRNAFMFIGTFLHSN